MTKLVKSFEKVVNFIKTWETKNIFNILIKMVPKKHSNVKINRFIINKKYIP